MDDLCNCDFIRRFSPINKKQRDFIYQLTDLFSLFHLRYIKDSIGMDDTFWTDTIDSPSHRAWCGYAFEQVCLHHIKQILSLTASNERWLAERLLESANAKTVTTVKKQNNAWANYQLSPEILKISLKDRKLVSDSMDETLYESLEEKYR